MKFIFLGRGGLLTSIVLEKLVDSELLPVKVIIEDDGKSLYPNLTKNICTRNKLEYQVLSELASVKAGEAFSDQAIDFVLVASLGSIIKMPLLDIAPFYNVHMGVLPDYKGALTNFWKIKNGDDIYGVTVHKMDEKIDSGDICLIREQNFDYAINASQFFNDNYQMAAEAAVDFLIYFQENHQPPEVLIDKEQLRGTYYPKFQDKDLLIDLSKSVAHNYKFINRIQFYGNPYILIENEKQLVKNANLLMHLRPETGVDPNYEIRHISENSIVVTNNSGILELKL